MRAAFGFRTHTGWAAAVVAAPGCKVLERRRIVFEPKATRFIYHRAAELSLKDAIALINSARQETVSAAQREIAQLIQALVRQGAKLEAACVPGGNAKIPEALAEILGAHSRIHAAEGAFYRNALADACAQLELTVVRAAERDLASIAARDLSCGEDELRKRLLALGKPLGPPWGEDQKLATLAALIALASQRAEGGKT